MIDRTPYCHKIRYGITGAPTLTEDEMDGTHAPGIGVSPTLIELVYSAARDGKPAHVNASVTGDWTRFGKRADGQVTTHFANGPDGWPDWLAEEARLHDPAAGTAPATTQADWPSRRAGLRDEIAAALEAADYRLDMRRGDLADAVMPVLYREWPWLRAEAEDTELTAEEARALADDLGTQLYRAEDALGFVAECCTIAEREQKPITTADVREWLKGARCARQLAADAADRAALRDAVVAALLTTPRQEWPYKIGHEMWDHHKHGDRPGHNYAISCALCTGDVDALATAVLAVLPDTSRAAVLREAADTLARSGNAHHRNTASRLRRMADEEPRP